jgi:D-alanyl-D-alanine carboxypeptidase
MKTNLKIAGVAVMTSAALGSLTGLSSCQRQRESALKRIDQSALQTLGDATAKELLIPGAVVLLRTPQGVFAFSRTR